MRRVLRSVKMSQKGEIRGGSLVVERSLFQATDGGSIPTSPHQLVLREITKKQAQACYEQWHYLGKKGFVATHNFGVTTNGHLWGCISYKPPSAEETVKGILGTTDQSGVFEIGRLALSDALPKNSESRVIAVSLRLLRKMTPVKAVITYADTAAGHTGIIYRATGFEYRGLTAPKSDFWVDGKIQERGPTKGVKGEWKPRSRKHLFVKVFV